MDFKAGSIYKSEFGKVVVLKQNRSTIDIRIVEKKIDRYKNNQVLRISPGYMDYDQPLGQIKPGEFPASDLFTFNKKGDIKLRPANEYLQIGDLVVDTQSSTKGVVKGYSGRTYVFVEFEGRSLKTKIAFFLLDKINLSEIVEQELERKQQIETQSTIAIGSPYSWQGKTGIVISMTDDYFVVQEIPTNQTWRMSK